MIGHVLGGKYELSRLIGEGGMGAVYEAKRVDDEARVAVKVLSYESLASETILARFWREADAAKKVSSPHIVEIIDRGIDEKLESPFIVMELLEGEDALSLLERLGPLPPDLAVKIAVQTARGLADAHAAGVVHRDVKPANIFLAHEGDQVRVKLLDFGVAKFKMDEASRTDGEVLTRTGSMLGSPMYMAPEQARGLKSIDHRADLWSLGIVLHQLLTDKLPHRDVDALGELILAICSDPPALVTEDAPWVPSALAEAIAGALRLDPDARYPSAAELSGHLLAAIGERGEDATITSDMLVTRGEAAKLPRFGVEVEHDDTIAVETRRVPVAIDAEPRSSRSSERPEPTSKRRIPQRKTESLDETTLARHREAQRTALAAARLDVPGTRRGMSNRTRVLLSMLAGLAFGAGGLVAYLRSLDAQAAPQPPRREAPIPEAREEAPSPPPEPSEAPQTPQEPEPPKVEIEPATAGVLLNGARVADHGGAITLAGEPGSRHDVVLTVGSQSKSFVITLTPDGPRPERLVFVPEPPPQRLPPTGLPQPPPDIY